MFKIDEDGDGAAGGLPAVVATAAPADVGDNRIEKDAGDAEGDAEAVVEKKVEVKIDSADGGGADEVEDGVKKVVKDKIYQSHS